MRVLLINVNYGIGSTGKIVESLFNYYSKQRDLETYCIYGRHSTQNNIKNIYKSCFEIESKFWHFLSKISGNLYGGMPISTFRIKSLIRRIKPDIVHLHCLNGFFVNVYSLLIFLKKKNIKTVLTNHADFMFTGNCGCALDCTKWRTNQCLKCNRVKEFNGVFSLKRTNHFYEKMEKSFRDFDNLVVTNVSEWLTNKAKSSPILKNFKHYTILNPVEISKSQNVSNPYLNYILPENSQIILHITTDFYNPEKGGQYIYPLAKEMPNSYFFIKSKNPVKTPSALKNVIFIEEDVNQSNLYNYYNNADITIVLSKTETFSMVTAESLYCGTPVVGFKAGGPETIAIPQFSKFVENGNIALLVNEIINILNKDLDKETISTQAKDKYSISRIASEYLTIYNQLLK